MSDVLLIKHGANVFRGHVPFHPVVVCGKRRVARWCAGWSGDGSWVWSHERGTRVGGWLLERWNGLDIDYGHVVRGLTLPDGTDGAFSHEHTGRDPWPLIPGAVWWDEQRMPGWLADMGVVYAPDRFSQDDILRAVNSDDRDRSRAHVERPDFWPTPAPLQTWEITDEPRIPNGVTVAFTTGIGCYEQPATGDVVALTATLELPNGRYRDAYTIRLADGSATTRFRDLLERANPDAVAHPPHRDSNGR